MLMIERAAPPLISFVHLGAPRNWNGHSGNIPGAAAQRTERRLAAKLTVERTRLSGMPKPAASRQVRRQIARLGRKSLAHEIRKTVQL